MSNFTNLCSRQRRVDEVGPAERQIDRAAIEEAAAVA